MNKKIFILALAAMMASGVAMSQEAVNQISRRPHNRQTEGMKVQNPERAQLPTLRHNKKGIEVTLAQAFPTAADIRTEGKWKVVLDENGKKLGYAVYSSPESDSIYGWGGQTPVMLAFNKKKVITGVYILPNLETPKFVQRIAKTGFFDSWNGLSVKKAKKKKVDTVSGATFTSRSVQESVQAVLQKL